MYYLNDDDLKALCECGALAEASNLFFSCDGKLAIKYSKIDWLLDIIRAHHGPKSLFNHFNQILELNGDN